METTSLVKKGDLDSFISEELAKEEKAVTDLKAVLEVLPDGDMRKKMQVALTKIQQRICALQEGFIPIDSVWTIKVSTKSKWAKREVRQVVDNMPAEVKEAWERVKVLDIFPDFGVSGRRLGDPLLVGYAGGRRFFIATWLNFPGGRSVGFTTRGKKLLGKL